MHFQVEIDDMQPRGGFLRGGVGSGFVLQPKADSIDLKSSP